MNINSIQDVNLKFTDKINIGYQNLTVTSDTIATKLTIPTKANYAIIRVVADSGTSNKALVIRFRMDGTDPTSSEGMPIGDKESFDINETQNLANFRVISIEASKTHNLYILYFE